MWIRETTHMQLFLTAHDLTCHLTLVVYNQHSPHCSLRALSLCACWGKKNPQGIPQLVRSYASKFKWRTAVLDVRNGHTSGGKGKVHSLHWTRSPVFSRAVFQTKHSLEKKSSKDLKWKPAKLLRHWWLWQFKNEELKMGQDCFSHHSHSSLNTDNPGSFF